MSEPIDILIVEDSPDDAMLLVDRLENLPGFETRCHVESNPKAVLERIEQVQPRLLFLDYKLGLTDGIELAKTIRGIGWTLPIVVTTGQGSPEVATRFAECGIDQYFVKGQWSDESLIAALVRLTRNGADTAPQLDETRRRMASLSPREREVLDEMVAGLSSKQIAAKFHRSVETIKVHRGRILQKMAVDSTPELVRIVMEARLGQDENVSNTPK